MKQKPFKLSVKVIIKDSGERCLLLKRSMASKNNKGKWDLPGGKVDAAESFDDALLREVAEETGLVISLKHVAGTTESELQDCIVAYIILEGNLVSGKVRLSEEHENYAWVSRSKLPDMDLCPQFRRFAEQYTRSIHKSP